MNRYSFWCQW